MSEDGRSPSAVSLLPWLRPAPGDFRARLKAGAWEDLANHALNLDQLFALDRGLTRSAAEGGGGFARPPKPMRLALLAAGSMEFVVPALRATALRHGLSLAVHVPAFGDATADLMNPDSALARFAPEAAVLAPNAATLGLATFTMSAEEAAQRVAAALDQTAMQIKHLRAMGVGIVVVQTVALGPLSWTGHLDRSAAGSPRAQGMAYNAGLVALAAEASLIVLDIAAVAGLVGEAVWTDAALWHRAKVPMALDVIPLYADHVLRLLRVASGRTGKCLVLDLDNTCWGGVIGDDGLDGIRIGQGSADGEAFLAIQHYALALKSRGIVLAVCSKNEETTAREPFVSHPDMALRLDDIAVFVANWTDKASNMVTIAKTLNIGTDALVFLDDNPAERARVRQSCPEVAVPEVGDDPALYPALLAQGGYFETLALTADDAKRADQYKANAVRAAEMTRIGDYDAYLASLEMTCEILPFDAVGRSRIAQLIGKSNQFNLTTRRYSEAEVAQMEHDPDVLGLQVRLNDRFGDNGMISVVIFRKHPDEWVCDTWLMSCRVLKRRVEEAVLGVVVAAARQAGATALIGDYLPTAKNAMVADHFEKLGFVPHGAAGEGGTRWRLPLQDHHADPLPMTLLVPLQEVA